MFCLTLANFRDALGCVWLMLVRVTGDVAGVFDNRLNVMRLQAGVRSALA
jgi:hypothetical protein